VSTGVLELLGDGVNACGCIVTSQAGAIDVDSALVGQYGMNFTTTVGDITVVNSDGASCSRPMSERSHVITSSVVASLPPTSSV
jgi:hypothetical protein